MRSSEAGQTLHEMRRSRGDRCKRTSSDRERADLNGQLYQPVHSVAASVTAAETATGRTAVRCHVAPYSEVSEREGRQAVADISK